MLEREGLNPWKQWSIRKLDLICELYKKIYLAGYNGRLRQFVDDIVTPLRNEFYDELRELEQHRLRLDPTILKEDFDPLEYLKGIEDKFRDIVVFLGNLREKNPKLFESLKKLAEDP